MLMFRLLGCSLLQGRHQQYKTNRNFNRQTGKPNPLLEVKLSPNRVLAESYYDKVTTES